MAGGVGKPDVPRDQGCIKHFCKCHVNSVISGQVMTQFPDTGQQKPVRIALDGKRREVVKGGLGKLIANFASCGVAAYALRDFNIHQMRRMQARSGCKQQDLYGFF